VKHLRQLEDQSVYILREAYKHFDHLAMLWSMGKDSTVLLWLARKAFFGHVPFPLLHVDTSYKIPAMIEYRDRIAREWRLNFSGRAKQRSPGRGNESIHGTGHLLHGPEDAGAQEFDRR
jgi:3''-phosphoadenosine 5''-phosphosulfate sulfotransferase (PAPS reductase)/FAD synthetase and related enzymes